MSNGSTLATADGIVIAQQRHVDVSAPIAKIEDGYYTVAFTDGSHVTLRFKTQDASERFMPGKQLVASLTGPDNTRNYTAFGTVNRVGSVDVWSAHRGKVDRQTHAVEILTGSKAAQVAGLTGFGMTFGRCGICHRTLSTPDSIARGIGPDCASRLGL